MRRLPISAVEVGLAAALAEAKEVVWEREKGQPIPESAFMRRVVVSIIEAIESAGAFRRCGGCLHWRDVEDAGYGVCLLHSLAADLDPVAYIGYDEPERDYSAKFVTHGERMGCVHWTKPRERRVEEEQSP